MWLARLDVTDTPAVNQVVNEAFSDLGQIDVIVNNAGYGPFGAAEELTDEQIVHQLRTNLMGSIQVTRAALPHLREQSGARIIQRSTYGGQATNPGASLYHATKWGIEGFMESVAKEVAPLNIEITIVEPGGARTEFRFGSLQLAKPMKAYDSTPAAMVRNAKDKSRLPIGDPAKMAAIIIDSVDKNPAPKRIVLGSDSYNATHKALSERLADLEVQKISPSPRIFRRKLQS
ncbi:SDR family oxidoreductase [Alicyclobacillus fastidiosus]|uniref:SDR family oxidoreductase n=1 Tax=Alicyclobacillus fastidiosus TaxID=392011 RepID=A0ABV5AJD3_9BACL|nr:SDR family oxidoreductase [Alicyclobacillus fastidiosus]WEH09107.1 SDR family oxidoreductase [Alicyclobacillus fastidiosus]